MLQEAGINVLDDLLGEDGQIRIWKERKQVALPAIPRSAYEKLIGNLDLEK